MLRKRKQVRLKNYDYSAQGAYFITLNTYDRKHSFGEVVRKEMKYSDVGKISIELLENMPDHYRHIELDEFVVMPDHIHFILLVSDESTDRLISSSESIALNVSEDSASVVRVSQIRTSQVRTSQVMYHQERTNQFSKPIAGSVSTAVQQYKGSVKRWCNKNGFPDFKWQARFYDHIIRDFESFERIRKYIRDNPSNWKT